MQTAVLVEPAFKYKKSFLKALVEIKNEVAINSFSASMFENKLKVADLQKDMVFKNFLNRIKNNVLKKTFWLVTKDEFGEDVFIGRLRIRYQLDINKKYLGHIGYLIRPSMRNLGYGSLILKLALVEAKKIVTDSSVNQDKILVACKADNLFSRKIILKNGGVLESEIDLGKSGREMLFSFKS